MDIRDIKEEVPNVGTKGLEEIFNLQLNLVQKYIDIEGLPPYPININTRAGQSLIKDFISRVIEELGEAWESYLVLMDMFHRGYQREDMVPHLQNFNEELGDALHFHMELMIYSGISIKDITDGDNIDAMTKLLKLGEDNLLTEFPKPSTYASFVVIKDEDLVDEFLRGGRHLSKKHMAVMERYLWRTTYWYQVARNTLKNKPWKQSQMLTDELTYKQYILRANELLFQFFYFIGMTPRSLFTIYYKKNLINCFRIKSNY